MTPRDRITWRVAKRAAMAVCALAWLAFCAWAAVRSIVLLFEHCPR
jgi:hypothetical protein